MTQVGGGAISGPELQRNARGAAVVAQSLNATGRLGSFFPKIVSPS
jgi:hypothetical protein